MYRLVFRAGLGGIEDGHAEQPAPPLHLDQSHSASETHFRDRHSKSPPEYFPRNIPGGRNANIFRRQSPDTSAEKMADLDRLGAEVAAKFLFQHRATHAAVRAATGEDRMEIDSAEVGPELTEEQHRQALDAESRVVYLMEHLGEDCV